MENITIFIEMIKSIEIISIITLFFYLYTIVNFLLSRMFLHGIVFFILFLVFGYAKIEYHYFGVDVAWAWGVFNIGTAALLFQLSNSRKRMQRKIDSITPFIHK